MRAEVLPPSEETPVPKRAVTLMTVTIALLLVAAATVATTASAATGHRLAGRAHGGHRHAPAGDVGPLLERLLRLLQPLWRQPHHHLHHHHHHHHHNHHNHHHHRLTAPHVPFGVWDRLAVCETGGDWRWGSQFVDPAYQGGIGFATSTWLAYRLPGYPPEAWLATRDQQIAVGRRVLAAVGPGAWGCAGTVGLSEGA